MDWIKQRTHVIDHPRFLTAGAAGRDLWAWGMLYSGLHELDGELPQVAVLATPWGAGGPGNGAVADHLVVIGLWERTEAGYRILRWKEQGNLTAAEISAEREAARERMSRRRSPSVRPNTTPNSDRTSVDVPTSTSLSGSLSGYGSPEGMQGEPSSSVAPDGADVVRRDLPLADDARQVFDAIALCRPVGQEPDVTWSAFTGHYAGQPFPSREAILGRWQKWVTTQASYAAKERVRDADRLEASEERRRFAKDGPRKAPAPSKAESARFASELATRLLGAKAVGS